MDVSTAQLPDIGKGFDSELGLKYIELTPDGGSARLEISDKSELSVLVSQLVP